MSASLDGQWPFGMLGRGFHDLRTPVAAAFSACEMLEVGWHRMPEYDRLRRVSRMRDSLGHAIGHLNRLQLIVRLERGLPEQADAPFDLRSLVEEIATQARALVRGGPAIPVRIVGDLPEIPGERELMRALLFELLDNAVKFSPPGTSVEVRLGAYDSGHRVEVLDESIGVPEGEEEAIFEPFRRGSNATHFPGSGLGLALARRIATRFGGSLVCASGLRGHFVLVLPGPGGVP